MELFDASERVDHPDVFHPISSAEKYVLRKVLERDWTSKQSHGGLKGVLALSDDDAETLLNFLRRI